MAKSRRKSKIKQPHLDELLAGEVMKQALRSAGHDEESFRDMLATTKERVDASKEKLPEGCLD